MTKYLMAGVAVVALSTTAFAADLGARQIKPTPYVAPIALYTFTGFYIGVNAGYAFSNSSGANYIGNTIYTSLRGNVPQSYSLSRDGFSVGAQAGYNQQFGQFVAGIEADIAYTDLKRSQVVVAPLATGIAKAENTYVGTLRGRLGFVPVDRLLLYVTGGLAYGESKLNNTITGTGALTGATWAGGKSDTRFGYALGAGAEYAVTNNISIKGEYLYYNLGRRTVTAGPTSAAAVASGAAGVLRTSDNSFSLVRAGLNYKF